MAKKTVSVEKIKDAANNILRNSTCAPDIRKGVMNMVEFVLHETDNYRGFRYLMYSEIPAGDHKPGINYDPTTNMPCADMADRFGNTDSTRVQYF